MPWSGTARNIIMMPVIQNVIMLQLKNCTLKVTIESYEITQVLEIWIDHVKMLLIHLFDLFFTQYSKIFHV